jgi:Integrase core domain/GAG-pre-integrase domain
MVDSGATHHITPYRPDFASWAPALGSVSLGGHTKIKQIGSGDVIIKLKGGDRGVQLTLQDVMHVPAAHTRYFSVGALLRKGGRITFENMGFTISMGTQILATGYMEDNLFWFDSSNVALHAAHSTTSYPLDIWHQRMGHMSFNALTRYSESVKGLEIKMPLNHDQSSPCAGCELGKQTRLPFSASAKQSDRQLQVVHSDLAGPMQVQSIQKASYIATFVDDYSRHGVVYFLRTKDQCADAFRKFLAWAENQSKEKVLTLHSDCEGEYMSGALQAFLAKKGIEHRLMMPYLPQ